MTTRKLITIGPTDTEKPWVGKELTCLNCKWKFLLREQDRVRKTGPVGQLDFAETTCPNTNCRSKVIFAY